jgi:hypothetical protein
MVVSGPDRVNLLPTPTTIPLKETPSHQPPNPECNEAAGTVRFSTAQLATISINFNSSAPFK